MSHPARNYGQNSTSRNIRKKGRKVNPSYPSGNPASEETEHPTQQGGNRVDPLQGGNPASSLQGKQGVYTHETTAFADGTKLVINVIPPPPLPIFSAPPSHSWVLEPFDEKTKWEKLIHISDEEFAKVCAPDSKAFHSGGYTYQAKKPSTSKGYPKYDYNVYI